MKKLLFAAAAIAMLAVASCKKDDDNNSPSRRELLTDGKWLTTSIKIRTNFLGTDTSFDLFSNLDACERDNLTIFRASDGHLIDDAGATKCDPADQQQIDEGTWTLTQGDSILTLLNTGQEPLPFRIKAFTASALDLQLDSNIAGFSATFLVSYTHQH